MADALYRRIAEDLRQRIESGEIPPGSQLPTELELREQFDNASRNTVRDAIKWLTTRGLVRTQPGRGTFVVDQIKPFIMPLTPSPTSGVGGGEGDAFKEAVKQQGGTPSASEPRVEVQLARDEVARELGIAKGASVVVRHQRRFIDGKPSSLQTSFYPMDFIQRGAVRLLEASDIAEGVTDYLKTKLAIEQGGYRDRLTVRAPNPGETSFFRIPDDGTVLIVVTHRTAYDLDVKPIRYTVTTYPADRNHFVIDFGEVPSLQDLIRNL